MSRSMEKADFLSAKKLELLEARLRQKGIGTLQTQRIARRGELAACPLSFAQQRLWFLDQLQPDSPVYLIPTAMRLSGTLDAEMLERSLQELARRHEVLRTTFEMRGDQPVQVIHPVSAYRLPVVDLRALEQEERENEAKRLAEQEAQRTCNLVKGPLLRTYLFSLETQKHVLLVTMHHIISDAWSGEIFRRELVTLYRAFAAGQSSPLPHLPIQYADFAVWQRSRLQGTVLETQLAYWRQQLQGVSPLDLPTDYPRPRRQTFRGSSQTIQLPQALYEKLVGLSQQEGVTLFMLLLAAFQALLVRYSGQSDISVGTVITNRSRTELEGLIGFFANTLVLRTDLSANPSFLEVVQRVRTVALDAYAHQDIPFEQLVEELQHTRDLSRPPLFQVTFRLQQMLNAVEGSREMTISTLGVSNATAKFEISVVATETPSGLVCAAQYNTDLFKADTIQRFLEHWHILLQGVVAAPQSHIADLPLLSEAERHQLLIEWNATRTEVPAERCLQRLFEMQETRTPDAIAITHEEVSLSYAALNRLADQVAAYLQSCGLRPQTPVALYMERLPHSSIALLGLLKAGGIYVPLDPALPSERVRRLLVETGAAAIITQQSLYEALPQTTAPVLCMDSHWNQITQQRHQVMRSTPNPDELAYVMYTSGSTGRPKGVMVPHRAIVNRLWWGIADVGLQPGDRLAQVASWGFDIALWELFGPWLIGATVVVLSTQVVQDGRELLRRLKQEQVTVLHIVPSLLAVLVHEPDLASCQHLRCVQSGGEAVSAELVRRLWAVLPVPLHQYYGPTEAAISVTSWSGAPERGVEQISIGRPIANSQLYLVDQSGQLVVRGVRGELWIGGRGLAWGYAQQPEQTAGRFIPDPFSGQLGARLYRTGDIGRYLPTGEIEFAGRTDAQVKIRGHRIEPAEIEVMLMEHSLVRESVVTTREGAGGGLQLIAYVVSASSTERPSAGELRRYLQERLPDYMIPTSFVGLDALPLTANGKVDRRSLPATEQDQGEEDEDLVAPRTPLEELLTAIWSEVLGHPQVGIHDNFFALGGHSLLATRLIARMQAVLQVEVSLQTLFETPTIAELAEQVEQLLHGGQEVEKPPLVPVPRTQALPLSFAQQRLWFLEQLEPGNTAYLIPSARRLSGTIDLAALDSSLGELVRRHESLRTTFEARAGQPVQIIHPAQRLPLPFVNLQGLAEEEREREVRRLFRQERQQPCDLAHGPLLRISLLGLDAGKYVLLSTIHHIISDGWSDEVFYQELSALYRAFVAGQSSPLPPLSIQYADFAVWQRQWLQGEVLQRQLNYWKQQLAGAIAFQLPADHPRPSAQSYRGVNYSFVLSADLAQGLLTLSRQEGVTLFMTLLAAFQTLLYRCSGQADVVVGTDVANRTCVETEALIGFFVNLLPLRTNLSEAPVFRNVLYRVREVVLGAYAHQDIPFDILVEHLRLERRTGRTPLVNVLFVLQNIPTSRKLPDMMFKVASNEETTAKFDLALFLREGQNGIGGTVAYSTELFEARTIATLIGRFERLLHNAVAHPDTSIDLLDIYTEAEKAEQAKIRQRRRQFNVENLKAAKGKEIDIA